MTVIKPHKNYNLQGCKFVKTTKFVQISHIKYNYFGGNVLPKAFIHSLSNNSLKLTQIAYMLSNDVVIPLRELLSLMSIA